MFAVVDHLILFFFVSLVVCVTPGPDNIFVVAQSLVYGARAGFIVILGLCTGLVVHTSAVAFGVAAMMQASALAFDLLKVAGACYLLYLAWFAFRDSQNEKQKVEVKLTPWQLYRRGVIMNATNPKILVFFLAFLPQFVKVEYGSLWLQFILLGCLFILATLLVFNSFALLANVISASLGTSPKVSVWLNRITGLIFVGLAVNLLSAQL